MLTHFSLCVGVTAISLSACVNPQQIELMEREQRRLRSENATLLSEVEAARSNLADTRANMQQMQREISALNEKLEETRYQMGRQIGQSSRVGDQRIKDLEARLATLDEEFKAQGALLKTREEEIKEIRDAIQAGQKSAAATTDGTADATAAETETVKRDYETAWRALEKKDYKGAISRFKEFLKKHPKSKLAGNAQYWIGESHYALREFDQAILEFDTVRRKYPQGEKVSAALLKQGYAFAELGEKVNARLILQEVVEKYPQSPEATRAKQKLKSLES